MSVIKKVAAEGFEPTTKGLCLIALYNGL